MLHKLRRRLQDEKGFTLIELLVVILIIGILAAIALPAFIGQQKKGQDSQAKSDARNAVSQMESCFTDSESYASCDAAKLAASGLKTGTGAGEVNVAANAAATYKIEVTSKSNNKFTVEKKADGTVAKTCTTTGSTSAGCPSSLTW